MSLKGHYYKVSYCGRDSRFRLVDGITIRITTMIHITPLSDDTKEIPDALLNKQIRFSPFIA